MTLTQTRDTEIPGGRHGDPVPARPGTRLRLLTRVRDRDRGQTAIEFLGVTPLIILMLIALWQCALIGYTFSLAGNSADEAAHKGAIAQSMRNQECREEAEKHLPKAWRDSMRQKANCRSTRYAYKAEVKLRVPVLVPGVLNWPFTVKGNAAYPVEADR
ncbi:TadE family protein [Streptomyces sp. NPDC002225]|uniref:TadE/TadG family type IV pilus assembly protein n=1 Tax=unclassified Streptomyces TaxID=2593676 RepID=UPI003331DB69